MAQDNAFAGGLSPLEVLHRAPAGLDLTARRVLCLLITRRRFLAPVSWVRQRVRGSSLLVALSLSLVGLSAVAESYTDRVTVVPLRLYVKNEHGRVLVNVVNNSAEVLDVDVSCTFYVAEVKVATGSGSISRLPARRSDTLDILDRQSQLPDSVGCQVSRAEK
jgi:hypothetical protein